MKVNVIIFGQLTEITGQVLSFTNVTDTDALMTLLHQQYPALSGAKYRMAVNRKLVRENTILTENSTVALLPPFSGG